MIKSGFPKKWVGNSPMFFWFPKHQDDDENLARNVAMRTRTLLEVQFQYLCHSAGNCHGLTIPSTRLQRMCGPSSTTKTLQAWKSSRSGKEKSKKIQFPERCFFQMGLKMLNFCAHQTHRLGGCMGFILFFCIVIWVLYFYFYDVLCDHL